MAIPYHPWFVTFCDPVRIGKRDEKLKSIPLDHDGNQPPPSPGIEPGSSVFSTGREGFRAFLYYGQHHAAIACPACPGLQIAILALSSCKIGKSRVKNMHDDHYTMGSRSRIHTR